MKTILCFGDSNTWGYNPINKERYGMEIRWPCILRSDLGDSYWVIEEGLNGRTTVFVDPIERYRCGYDYLFPCLESHRPIDLMILMLGTNDMKKRFSASAYDIGKAIGLLLDTIQSSNAGPDGATPNILLLAPPPFAKLTEKAELFQGAEETSRHLAAHLKTQATEHGIEFMDTGSIIKSSELDGFHLDASEHVKLGREVAKLVRSILPL